MVTVTVCYVLVNVSYYTVMTSAELLASDAVAMVSTAVLKTSFIFATIIHLVTVNLTCRDGPTPTLVKICTH